MSSNNHFVRIVHHRYHLYIFPQCGYGHVNSQNQLLRIVHHRYHICMVYLLCGYEHVSSNDNTVRFVHHRYHIYIASPNVDTDMRVGLHKTN